jgi:predicted esterase
MPGCDTNAKIRLLVLHGFCDSAQNREHHMRSLIRSMKDIEFCFINSPFLFVDHGFVAAPEMISNEQRYQWMSYRPEWSVADYSYDTLSDSITHVIDYIHRKGPFDGLLGFSQGAIVCAAALLNIPHCPSLPDCVRFAILVGCPAINDSTLKSALEMAHQHKQLPTLHISGMNDTLVTSTMSKTIFNYFNNSQAEFYTHKGGHYCPSDAEFRQKLREFFRLVGQHECT